MNRHLSIKNYISLFFIGTYAKVIFAIWLAAIVILNFLYSQGDSDDFNLNYGETKIATGYVVNIDQTNVSVNDESIERYFYRFSVNEEVFSGDCYGALYLNFDEKVEIQYIDGDPTVSRIVGGDNSITGLFMVYFLVIAIFIISVLLTLRFKKTMKYSRIVGNGVITKSINKFSEHTNVRINNRTQYRLTYDYEVLDQEYSVDYKTTYPDDFKNTERIVYDRNQPEYALIFSTLPISIQRLIH